MEAGFAHQAFVYLDATADRTSFIQPPKLNFFRATAPHSTKDNSMARRILSPAPVLDEPSLSAFLAAEKIPAEHARRILQKMCQAAWPDREKEPSGLSILDGIPNLPKKLKEAIGGVARDEGGNVDGAQSADGAAARRPFALLTSTLVSATPASDGSTTKLLIRLQDGHLIESVLIRYGTVDIKSYPEELKEAERARAIERKRVLAEKEANGELNGIHRRKRRDSNSSVATTSSYATQATTGTWATKSTTTATAAPAPLLSFPSGPREHASKPRLTLCVSSQIGCRMACTFCATGTMDLLGSLHAGEILEQIVHAQRVSGERIRNIVWMGMGEPLDNYDAVRTAIKAMIDPSRFAMQAKRISISTVGVVPRLLAMKSDDVMNKVGLALSLHAGDQETRLKIIPTAKAWDIARIVDACAQFIENQNGMKRVVDENAKLGYRVEKTAQTPSDAQFRHLLLEYILIKDVNSLPEHAATLANLIEAHFAVPHLSVLTNLIPYNPVMVITAKHGYQPPNFTETTAFANVLKERGLKVLVRQEMGQDVGSACGQLVVEGAGKKKGGKEQGGVMDIEELGGPVGMRNRKANGATNGQVVVSKRTQNKEGLKREPNDDEVSLVPEESRVQDGFAPLLAARPRTSSEIGKSWLVPMVALLVVLIVLKTAMRIWAAARGQ